MSAAAALAALLISVSVPSGVEVIFPRNFSADIHMEREPAVFGKLIRVFDATKQMDFFPVSHMSFGVGAMIQSLNHAVVINLIRRPHRSEGPEIADLGEVQRLSAIHEDGPSGNTNILGWRIARVFITEENPTSGFLWQFGSTGSHLRGLPLKDRLSNEDVRAQFLLSDRLLKPERVVSGAGGLLRVPDGNASGGKSSYRCKGLPESDFGLVIRNENCLFGSVRRASRIVQGLVCGLFFGLCVLASFSVYSGIGGFGKVGDMRWIAVFAACLMTMIWCAGALISEYIWIPWG